jgi:hypothetical protein
MAVKRTASVRAISQCSFFVLTSDSFEMIKVYYPSIARSITLMINNTITKVQEATDIAEVIPWTHTGSAILH